MAWLAARLTFFTVLALALGACGSSKQGAASDGGTGPDTSGNPSDGGTAASPCDAPSIASCFAAQRVCSMRSGKPECETCREGEYASSDGRCEAIGGTAQAHEFT